jgi:hypothetical protein
VGLVPPPPNDGSENWGSCKLGSLGRDRLGSLGKERLGSLGREMLGSLGRLNPGEETAGAL